MHLSTMVGNIRWRRESDVVVDWMRVQRDATVAWWHSVRVQRRLHLTMLSGGLLALVGVIVFIAAWNALPNSDSLAGRVHAQMMAHQSTYVPLSAIAAVVPQALISIEDRRFYQHHGIDVIALGRALWIDLQAGSMLEGGGTLTGQLAKVVYLNGYDHTIPRKAEDMVLALKIESHYTKQQILEMYLNVVYFGEGTFGIAQASSHYFGRTPAQLDLAQSALLMGLLQNPTGYDPWCHPALAQIRQQTVLDTMQDDGKISSATLAAAKHEMLPFWSPGAKPPAGLAC